MLFYDFHSTLFLCLDNLTKDVNINNWEGCLFNTLPIRYSRIYKIWTFLARNNNFVLKKKSALKFWLTFSFILSTLNSSSRGDQFSLKRPWSSNLLKNFLVGICMWTLTAAIIAEKYNTRPHFSTIPQQLFFLEGTDKENIS